MNDKLDQLRQNRFVDRVLSLPWPQCWALVRFFVGLFPVPTYVLYTLVASSWLRSAHCTEELPYGFLVFFLVMLVLSGFVQFTNLWFYQYDSMSVRVDRTHFVLRQTLVSVLHQFVWTSLGVSAFHCFPNYKPVFMVLVPMMAVSLLLAELVRYTITPLDLVVHWQQLSLSILIEEHQALDQRAMAFTVEEDAQPISN